MSKDTDLKLARVRIVTRTGRTHDIYIPEESYDNLSDEKSDFLISFDEDIQINISSIESIQVLERVQMIQN